MPIALRVLLTLLLLIASVVLPFFGYWGTSTTCLIIGLIGVLTYFKNEKLIITLYHLQKQNLDKAKFWINKINPTLELRKKQLGYYHLIMGTTESATNYSVAEKHFKKALNLGLKGKQDRAMAKLGLASGAMMRRNKREAITLINEAKKLDTNKLLAEQIRMMNQQLKRI